MKYSRINNAYVFTDEENNLIEKCKHQGSAWNDPQLISLKKNIRLFLRQEQGAKCCYCKRWMTNDISGTQIDHIVSRNEYVGYMFEPYNLALTCPGCNEVKKRSKILNIVPSDVYSHKSEDYKIVHPYFDEYDKHIRQWGAIREALSKKGEFTIRCCNLSRLINVEKADRADKAQNGTAVERMVYTILNSNIHNEVSSCLNDIDKFIKGVKII